MASDIVMAAPADFKCKDDSVEDRAPNCAWVIPVLLDSHATAAASLAYR
jgi:hypothetical protein